MIRETSSIFLSPAILKKNWISQVRKNAEITLQFAIVMDLKYDGERTYDFAHTISREHVKDLTAKLYNRFFNKFDMKLLTKKPRNGVLPVDGGEICINHENFDTELKKTCVYCILSMKGYSLYPDRSSTTFKPPILIMMS
jgi:hypothetical protein